MIELEKLLELLPKGMGVSVVTTEPQADRGEITLATGVSHGATVTYTPATDEPWANDDLRNRYAIAFIEWVAHNYPQALEAFYIERRKLDDGEFPMPMHFGLN